MVAKEGTTLCIPLLTVPIICDPLIHRPIEHIQERFTHLQGLDLDLSTGVDQLKLGCVTWFRSLLENGDG